MTIHEKIQALVSELSDDYLFVVFADGKLAVSSSDREFAQESLKDIQEFLDGWQQEIDHRSLKHHHSPERPKPSLPESGEQDK